MRVATFTKIVSVLLVLGVAGSLTFGEDASPAASELVNRMGDSRLTQAQREAAAGELLKLGKEAMPTLIGALHDNRVYLPDYTTPSGTNAPSLTVDLTVGLECDYILTEIVSNGASTKMMGFRYKIFNWPDWWKKHRNMSERDIQKEAKWYNHFMMESTGKGDSIPHLNQP
ncbi:MAG TPA: hypothetical protein VHY22_01890 [Chthoniobacteraceae bacterium]|jgi:hypothetical protein|nr:hypothetical protein [Chthoniobacteraceae bacterium]